MLNMTRNTIDGRRRKSCIASSDVARRRVTNRARLPRPDCVDGRELLVTARTGHQAALVTLYAFRRLQAIEMHRVELTAELCLLVLVAGRRAVDLGYSIGHLAIHTLPFPNSIDGRITV